MITKLLTHLLRWLPMPLQRTFRNRYVTIKGPLVRERRVAQWRREGSPLPPPQAFKETVIDTHRKTSGYTTFIETGTYLGDMVAAQRDVFKRIISIELGEALWQQATTRFKNQQHITILRGNSSDVLNSLVQTLTEPAIFWLDAHYSQGITARGNKECPILEELDVIFTGPPLPHILLIDDARCFTGHDDYPTIDTLTRYVQDKNSDYVMEVKDDIIRFVPVTTLP